MNKLLISWQTVGSTIVPLAILVFLFFYFLEKRKLLEQKKKVLCVSGFANTVIVFIDTQVSFLNRNPLVSLIFDYEYLEILETCLEKVKSELELVTVFETQEQYKTIQFKSFKAQWWLIHNFLYDEKWINHDTLEYTYKPFFGRNVTYWGYLEDVEYIIENKIIQLYSKYILHVLRTEDFLRFDYSLVEEISKSRKYNVLHCPYTVFSHYLIQHIIDEYFLEIMERVDHAIKHTELEENNENRIWELEKISATYFLANHSGYDKNNKQREETRKQIATTCDSLYSKLAKATKDIDKKISYLEKINNKALKEKLKMILVQ